MNRREELLDYLGTRVDPAFAASLVDEVVFLEGELKNLKQFPFIKVHPQNPAIQKSTSAAKLYTQLSAQYNSAIRTLFFLIGDDGKAEDSPLRKWAKEYSAHQ